MYDNAGRLDQITGPGLDGGYVEYTYLSNAPGLIASRTVYDSGDAAVTTTTHTYEAGRNNVTSVLNKSGSTTVSDYTYAYNDVNQRTHNGKSGTAFGTATHVAYTYDALRQVTEAERFTGVDFDNPGTAIPAQTFGYAYDTIGNRLTSRLGTIGTPIEETDYTTNALNQYTEIAHLPSSSSQLPIFDADGNLIEQDGWVYKWDAENRLIEAKVKTPSTSADRRLTFVYDAEGRRVEKRVFEWSGTVWLPIRRHTFVWAGWSMLLEHIDDEVASTDETIAYLWGLDLAGRTDATGNVGALLAIETDSVQGVYFYDANGNVGQVIDVTDGSLIASYEYSPFGEVISSSGSFAETNRFRFSTKYQDAETLWLYYGFRYYDPETGRWLNRDPIEEAGGLNLYGFVGNDTINQWDLLGLKTEIRNENEVWYIDTRWFGRSQGCFHIGTKIKVGRFDVVEMDGRDVASEGWLDMPYETIKKHGNNIFLGMSFDRFKDKIRDAQNDAHRPRGNYTGWRNPADYHWHALQGGAAFKDATTAAGFSFTAHAAGGATGLVLTTVGAAGAVWGGPPGWVIGGGTSIVGVVILARSVSHGVDILDASKAAGQHYGIDPNNVNWR